MPLPATERTAPTVSAGAQADPDRTGVGSRVRFRGPRFRDANWLWAAAGVALGLLLLLAVQVIQFGRPGLEKMLTELAMPLGLLWCVLAVVAGYGAIGWWRSGSAGEDAWEAIERAGFRRLLVLSLGLWLAVTLFGNRSLATWAWTQTQYPIAGPAVVGTPPHDSRVESSYVGDFDAVILLGGGISADPLDRPQLGKDGDRIRLPLQLWHAGRVPRIFVTGTSASPDERGPADLTEELLVSFGVPAAAITQVPGRNTSEEMKSLRKVIPGLPSSEEGSPPRVGLVTSAFHMPRALRLARGEGLELVPLSVAYRGGGISIGWSRRLVPTADAMQDVSACWKEWLAGTVGR